MSGGYVNAAFAECAGDPSVFHTIELSERRDRSNRVAPTDEHSDKQDQSSSGAGSPAGDGMQTIPLGGCKLEMKQDPRFGWSVLKPACLQRFRTAKWALFWLCWAGALQGMVVNGFVNVVITTIERRFGLRSSQTGLIAGGYDIASFLCLVPVTYLGGRAAASKPRWFGWGVLLMGGGSLVFALPHFAVGLYRGASDDVDICQRDGGNGTENPTSCSAAAGGETPLAVWVFLAAQLLHGAGAAPLFTLGVTYIDENVSKKMSSVYLGIYYTMAVIGPALGYVVGGQLLTLYTDFASVDPAQVGMTPASTVWVGAWWVGFLMAAALCIVIAVPLLGFPPSLPGAEELQKERVSEAHDGDASRSEAFGKIRELPKAFLVLMKNPTFVFLNLAGSSEGMLISGFAAFLPKLMENQFTVNASTAALLLGVITVPAGGGGTFLGGYLVKKWNLNCAGIIRLCVIATLVGTAFTLCFFLSCPNLAFAGITQAYRENVTESVNPPALDSVCNTGCACAHVEYAPVCGADGVTYFSPCHAGCAQRILMLDNMQLYADCACIAMPPNRTLPAVDVAMNDIEISTAMFSDKRGEDGNSTFGAVSSKGSRISVPYEAINRSCQSDCPYLWIFVALAFGIMFFTFLATMPALSATLRCVRDDQRSFALGIQWIKVRLLGTIPAPMIFGFLIDETCILWQKSCDGPGACLVYDNLNMSRYMLALAFIGKFCSLLFFFLAWWFYKPPQQAKIDGHQLTSSDVKLQSNGGTNGYLNGAVDHNERY